MDANKLIVLRDLPYEIKKVCALCKHGNFPKNEWGMCEATTYSHKKHSESLRNVSIHKFGSCPSFESDIKKVSQLGTFMEFAGPPEEKIDFSLYECEECSTKPGSPTLCERCLAARAAAGKKWRGSLQDRHLK